MTKAQKIIKYIAISIAVLLIVSIFYTILGIFSNIFGFSLNKEVEEYKVFEIKNDIEILDIEVDASKLLIKNGETLKVEANNEKIRVRESSKKLSIKEKTSLFKNNTNGEIIIYVPSKKNFREVSIDTGSASIDIELLSTNKLDFDLGAGSININSLNVSNEASIDSGAGSLLIEHSNITNLDLDMGVGKSIINGKLNGYNDIDAGIGELEINLFDSINNYKFDIEKGIGNIRINGDEVSNHYLNGSGYNKIEIDGGIGNININTNN